MELTIREKILDLLKHGDHALTSEEIATELGLKKRQIQEANSELQKQGRIKNDGKRPFRFSFNAENINFEKYTKVSPKKAPSEKVSKPLESFDFNKFMILYVTSDSSRPKMLHEFENVDELTIKFEELQRSSNLVSIAAYQKLEVVKKLELKIQN